MKDKRLDALLETLYEKFDLPIKCTYLDFDEHRTPQQLCLMYEDDPDDYKLTQCQGDIRNCEREE